ncbi:hypothetical protein NODU109028_19260 [Nocardioides dubius]|uniref:DUF983 domain-containing protein n=1 Tax=Nocardioides dubius TaxID=317019 RepID=A0ABP4E4H3_9ACTN
MKVRTPDGQRWRVSRRWVPWRRRTRSMDPGGLDVGFGDDPISLVLGILALIVLIPVLLLGLIALLEMLLLVVLLPVVIVARVVFGRRWYVEVRRGFRPWCEEAGGDWAASRARIAELAAEIEAGQIPAQTLGELPETDEDAAGAPNQA